MGIRGSLVHEPRILAPLVDISHNLRFKPNGRIEVIDRMPPILNEFGVPDRLMMVKSALASIATEHVWTGDYDLHHFAYEGREYRKVVSSSGEQVGSAYRGSALLKLTLPRQLHEYMHAIFETPPMPPIEVMRQYGRESDYVSNLFNTVKAGNYDDHPELGRLPHEVQESIRLSCLHRKLDDAVHSEFDIVPDIELLRSMEITQARKVLRALARASGFSNVPNCQSAFFDNRPYYM